MFTSKYSSYWPLLVHCCISWSITAICPSGELCKTIVWTVYHVNRVQKEPRMHRQYKQNCDSLGSSTVGSVVCIRASQLEGLSFNLCCGVCKFFVGFLQILQLSHHST